MNVRTSSTRPFACPGASSQRAAATFLLAASFLAAQPAASDDEAAKRAALAKAALNPVASMISVPFQNNTNFATGPYDRVGDLINIQPVIPFKLGTKWNLITRTIIPTFLFQPDPTSLRAWAGGMGDINPSFFLTPQKASKVIWGLGPSLVLPTATDHLLGQGKWSAGPSAILLVQPGKWTIGTLVNNVWSYAGDKDRARVNQLSAQYFINYNLKKGYYLASAPIITSNWQAGPGEKWTVPFGMGIGRIQKFGTQPVNWNLTAYGNAVHPTYGSVWTVRLQVTLLYPHM
jgi:hypothetical protein